MHLGIGTFALAWNIGVPGFEQPEKPLDPFAFLERVIELGAAVAQYADNLPLTALSPGDLARLRQRADNAGIALEVGTRGIEAQNLRANLRLARECGSPLVRVVVDIKGDEPTPEEVVVRLRPLVEEYADAGVLLALENHDRFSAATLAGIVKELGPENVGICLDTVNSFGALEGPAVVVETLAPYTRNLHVKDFTIRRATHNLGFVIEGAPAGEGRLDLPWLVRSLPSEISAIIELWPPPQPTLDRTLALENAWLQKSVENLRAFTRG